MVRSSVLAGAPDGVQLPALNQSLSIDPPQFRDAPGASVTKTLSTAAIKTTVM
jgi:hypothetical protein